VFGVASCADIAMLAAPAARVRAVNLGALVGFLMDARERRAFVAHLQTDTVGFRTGKDDSTWLWRFSLEPLKGDIDSPTGTAVALTALLGLPFARLRTAIPEEVRAQRVLLPAAALRSFASALTVSACNTPNS
jgi:hypothetical protein